MASNSTDDSLAARFAALQKEREQSWSAKDLAENLAQRRALLDDFDPRATVTPGDIVPAFELDDTRGGTLFSEELLTNGPAVLIFVRFADCPADNIALPYYDRALSAPLRAAAVPLVAISPQPPEKLDMIRVRHGLDLTVATDCDNRLARALRLTFTPLSTPEPPPPGWIGEKAGTDSWELPQTAVIIVDPGHRVRFAAISPDWLDRVEPDEVLAALNPVRTQAVERRNRHSVLS